MTSKVMTRQLPRDSFDRFGDDMCEYVISYLSINHKLRYECVSKQWQRLIPKTQKDLMINDLNVNSLLKTKDNLSFDWTLKKFALLTNVDIITKSFPLTEDMLISLVTHCHQLVHIVAYSHKLSFNVLDLFFEKFAKQLKKCALIWVTESQDLVYNNNELKYDYIFKKYVKDLSNLVSIDNRFQPFDMILFDTVTKLDKQVVSFAKLSRLSIVYTDQVVNQFEMFANNYKSQIKSVYVTIKSINKRSLDVFISSLSQMSKLIDFDVEYDIYEMQWTQPLSIVTNHMKQLGQNCDQLKKFVIKLGNFINYCPNEMLNNLFKTINENMKRLKRLSITGCFPENYTITSESLNGLKQLTHLSMTCCCSTLVPTLYDNIAVHLPRLQHLDLFSFMITHNSLVSLSKLPHIQTVDINPCSNFFHVIPVVDEELMKEFRKLKHIKISVPQTGRITYYFKEKSFEI